MKIRKLLPLFILTLLSVGIYLQNTKKNSKSLFEISLKPKVKKKKKTIEEKMLFTQERLEHELNMQRNPVTKQIPADEKKREFENSLIAKQKKIAQRTTSSTYVSRGPSNLGGRTRGMVIDITDPTSNTILAGGVSSGLFRTTDGGTSWTKVSANDEIHNVTAIAQDPRPGFQNIWYYATGERLGNSASLGSFLFGNGIWKSTDSGLTWSQIPETNSNFTSFDSSLDLISAIKVNPINGDLMIAAFNEVLRFDGTTIISELDANGGTGVTDVVITSTGRVYAAFEGSSDQGGVWTSPTGNGSWTRIAQTNSPVNWAATGRIVLGLAPSNQDALYVLYGNGNGGDIEADLWKFDQVSTTWRNLSSKLPDEPGGNLTGNDPFAIQGGYDLVVSVKPDNENFVVVGGTNVYKIENVITDSQFERIGGYVSNTSYGLYSFGGDTHHPDIHSLQFDPNNPNILFSGTDGGVHKTTDINASTVTWVNLNNNYQTYQYYHVAMDPLNGGNFVAGGAQDNGTTIGGTDIGAPNNTEMSLFAGGDGVAVGIARRNSDADLQVYAGTQNGNMFTNYPNGGRNLTPNGSSSQFVTYFYLDPDNNDNLYYAGRSRLFKTTDAENVTQGTWDNGGLTPTGEDIRSFATTRGVYDSNSSYLLIGGDEGGIFRWDDPANEPNLTSAVNITPSGASTSGGTIVSGLAIHPTNPDIALAVYANYGITNIFLTTNATDASPTWTEVERNLNNHSIRSAAITTVGSEIIYLVGTARGLYSSNDPTSRDWDIEAVDQIGFSVVSGLVYRPSDNKLLIGTHGNGMFETTVEATLSTNTSSLGELGLTMYPNPTIDELNFVSNEFNASDKVNYKISDLTGKLIQQGVLSDRKVNVRALNAGIYFINIAVNGKKQTLKFIKN